MSNLSDISVIIPVREGSTRVKDKVTLPFHQDMNLLEWKIFQLKQVHPADRIFVSTNSENLKAMGRNMGVEIHNRRDILCDGHKASFSDVITGIVEDMPTEHFAWVTVVVPLMSPEDYKGGFQLYLDKVVKEKSHDSLVSVNLMKEYLWNEEGALNYRADKNHTISQELPNIYRVTNGLYMRDKASTMEEGYFLGKNPVRHTVSKMAGIDIDEWEDYQFSKAMIPFYEAR
ncbi:MAG: acylneuraminate cytidylyltransferase [Sphingobacteriales bacterium]|nr:MAG: acylneuraminate cytidylyltransferase [Sphingobacteriales bacterium]